MRMYFQKVGDGKAIVVFMHGWGCDGSIFLPIAKRLSNCECYLLDFNGFGNSQPPPPSGWDVEDYAEALHVFFKMHNIKNACIVAHSFGGRVALVFAAKYPHLVERCVLYAPAGLRRFNLLRWLKVRNYKARKFLGKSTQGSGSVDYNVCESGMKNTFVKVVNQDLTKFAKRIKCPTLIVNGKSDTETPLKHACRLQKLIKQSTLIPLECDHVSLFMRPDVFAKIIQYALELGL